MAKDKDKKVKPPKPAKAPSAHRPRGLREVKLALAVAAAVVVLGGLFFMRRGVLNANPYSQTFARLQLVNLPDWLPQDIAQGVLGEIAAAEGIAGQSVYAPDLVRTIYDRTLSNPWISKVHSVHKFPDGRVEVSAEFRRPFALVRCENADDQDLTVVDHEGVVLPVPPRHMPGAVLIGDVRSTPPEPGRKWDAEDLAAGLHLLRLLEDRPYCEEVTMIDVRNFDGRYIPGPEQPHLRIKAQTGRGRPTDIRWGRFPAPDGLDYCVSPERKLEYLDWYYQTNGGRLAGLNSWIELRYDKLYVSPN